MASISPLYEAVLNGDRNAAIESAEAALAEGAAPQSLVNDHMIPAMDEVGRLFEENEYFVPELLISARAMKAVLEILNPMLKAGGVEPVGRVAIGTVKGDLHDIGKNLVSSMLEGGGFAVVDLGVDVAPETFVKAVREDGVGIVCLSALLTTTMPSMKTTIDALVEAGVRDQVKVLIGGAPVTQAYCDEIGADYYGANASVAVSLARKAVGVAV